HNAVHYHYILFFLHRSTPHRNLHSFPTRRSSDLQIMPDSKDSAAKATTCATSRKPRRKAIRMRGWRSMSTSPRSGIIWARTCCRSEEHTSELQSRFDLVCRLLLEKKKININKSIE